MPGSYRKGDHDFLARRLYRKIEDISDLKIHRFFPRVRTDEHVCHVKRSCKTGDHDFPEVIVTSTILPGSLPVSPRGKMLSTPAGRTGYLPVPVPVPAHGNASVSYGLY